MSNSVPSKTVVEYVVPDGFHGTIKIIHDPAGPVPTVAEERGSAGIIRKYVFTVSPDGRLVTSDISPMNDWHKTRARRYNGDKLATEGEASAAPGGIKLHELSDKEIVVGTQKDVNDFSARECGAQ